MRVQAGEPVAPDRAGGTCNADVLLENGVYHCVYFGDYNYSGLVIETFLEFCMDLLTF